MNRLCLAALLLAAAAPDPVIAVRGGDQMTLSQVRALIARADPQVRARLTSDPKALQDIIRDALVQKAVLEAAHSAKWDSRPDVVTLLARTRDETIVQSFLADHAVPPNTYPSQAELQAAYDQARPQLMQPRGYHLSQLSITLPSGAPPADVEKAKHTLAGLRDAFAGAHTPPLPTGVQASDLGWVAEIRLQPAAKDAVAGLLEGQVSAPVCTQPGCAILKLVATRPAGPAPLADVKDGLIRLMRQQKQRQAEQAYENRLLAHAPVRIDEIALSHLAGQ